MTAVTLLMTLIGATIGAIGFWREIFFLLSFGAIVCGLNEFLNVASGVYRVPFIATLLVIICSVAASPWYVGALFGLCLAGAMDALGEMYGRLRERRS